ncbi:dipeptide epimerase [Kordiimonas aestuarii]|uniref:dipeptide epimerase n=1 Tax=Kordiimonas aestuarii TaxID=1005925 RepID=UPI0021D3031F|nr:dipeptide epimerase [Kordiimonas aestuarii]
MRMHFEKVSFPLKAPFVITGYTFNTTDTVRVTLEADGVRGQGEGVGVYYLNDTADLMLEQLAEIAPKIEAGLAHDRVQHMLPPGGARNALDCALWDLEAKRSGVSVWERLNMTPKTLKTVCTVGIGSAGQMAATAASYAKYPNLKIKLDGDNPVGKLEAIRDARPDATLIIDVNQGWTFEELKEYAPACEKLGIAMIEQPLKRGGDAELEGYTSPVPLGGDESCLDASEYEVAASRYDVINIKLDKCGGLSAGLLLANMALRDGKSLMVGNMTGSSLSMAPAYVIGQFCHFVDIDGPLLLAGDVDNGLFYGTGGIVEVPNRTLWG